MDHAAALHPADETLLNYGLGKLDDTVAHTVNVHLEQCRPCRQRVSELSGDNFVQRLQQAQAAPPAAGAPGSKPGETVARTLVEAGGPTPSRAETSIGPRREVVSDPGPGSPPRTPPAFREPVPPELLEQSQYKIVRELGRGGMGVVYLAHNKMMGRPEVLKVMSREVAAIPGTVDRFLREIRSAARLQHPNVVTAYAAQKMGDLLVLSMEYVEGEDLARLVRTRGPLPLINALYYICQAAQGLQHAHEKGMVHRDIKPGNMILFREGKKATVKILDFGLAKVSSERKVDTTLTGHGQMLGTPDYVAPEQMLDAVHADIRADIYSLGCTLYCLLAGEAPFSGSSLFDLLQKHQSEEATPLNQIRRDVTPELAAVVARMMAKLPQQRYQTPSEVVQALKPFLKSGGTAKAPAELPPQDFATRPPESEAGVGNTLIEEAPVLLPLAPASPDERWKSLLDFTAVDSSTNRLSAIRDRRTAWPRWTWFAAGAGLLMAVFAVALALGVFRVKTANGVIVVEGLPGDAEVLVDGDKVTVTVPQTGQPAEITVVPGTHEIKVRKGDVTVFGERVSIASGGREEIRVQLQADPPVGTQVATIASAKPDVPADTVPMPDATPPPEPIPVTLNAASIPSDARAFGGHAYKFFPERLSWHAAQASCAAMGGHLIVIDSIYENEFAARLVGDAGALETWIGATDESTEGDWRTVDGRPLSYMNWFETQPNNMSTGENYALLSNRGGRDAPIGWKWFDESDESDQFQPGYICEWDDQPPGDQTSVTGNIGAEQRVLAALPSIPPDAQAFNGRFYKVYRETTSWENAAVRCTQMQGRLVAIRSAEDNDFIVRIANDAGINWVWIGLSDKIKEGAWLWMDGEPVTYSKWHRWPDGKSEPNDWRGEDYAFLSATEEGEWHDVQNDDSRIHGFVCQWDAPPTPPSIPSDARTFGGHSYKFFPEQLSWHAAKAECTALGGHLIVIDDAEENAFAATLVADAQGVDTWIGATDEEEEGNWKTVFGDPLPFQNWCTRPKQPNNKPPGEHFAVMSGQVFGNGSSKWQWHDQQDAAESVLHPGYLCEWDDVKPGISGVQQSQTRPVLSSLTELNTPGWEIGAWVSPNGRRIYWEAPVEPGSQTRQIWQAERADVTSPFQDRRALFEGRHPTLTSDERQIVFIKSLDSKRIFMASRESTASSFGPERELSELGTHSQFNCPWITADGLMLIVNARAAGRTQSEPYFSRRPDLDSNWGPLAPFPIVRDADEKPRVLTWLSTSPDALSLLATEEGTDGDFRVVRFRRKSTDVSFADCEYVKLPGFGQVTGKAPRYLEATRELYLSVEAQFSSTVPAARLKSDDPGDLLVIHDVELGDYQEQVTPSAAGWTQLFNGKNLDGWKTHPSQPGRWRINDGILTGSGSAMSHLYTERNDFTDFHLRVVARINSGGNSGVYFRSGFGPEQTDGGGVAKWPAGYEAQINSTIDGPKTGSLYMPRSAVAIPTTTVKPGEWFTMYVLVEKQHILITVNGTKTAEYRGDDQFTKGHIALQAYAQTVVEFRTIEIKELGTPVAENAAGAPATLPAEEPDGFVPLFNGKNLDGWKTHPSQPGKWRVENGVLIGDGPAASHLYTERNDFTDFHLRVEARINDGGNSGVKFRAGFGPEIPDRKGNPKFVAGYEAQINSTAGDKKRTGALMVDPGGDIEPVLNTAIRPGEWFTMQVITRQQHIIIVVNGTKTAECDHNQFLKGHISVQQFSPETVVEFRTIEIKELGTPVAENAAGAPATLPAEEPDGFVPLFNGKNLDGWKTHPSQPGKWRVENGVLSGSGPDISHLYTKRSNLTDFHLRVEARINEGGNSGVCFRTGFGPDIRTREGTPRYLGGYEAQINSTHKDPNRTGSLYVAPGGVKAPVLNTAIKPGEWFTMEVLVQKQHIVITVNGEQTAEYDDTTYTAGHIALQQHNAETVVEFRAIEIKEL